MQRREPAGGHPRFQWLRVPSRKLVQLTVMATRFSNLAARAAFYKTSPVPGRVLSVKLALSAAGFWGAMAVVIAFVDVAALYGLI